MKSFSEFISDNENADTVRLLLAGNRHPGIDMRLAANTIEVRRRLKKKVPSWYSLPGLEYPHRISGEQCSSETTALYKAGLAASLHTDGPASEAPSWKPRIADLTGGLGVDSWAFSKIAEAVLYNEADPLLADAARKNFVTLGCRNISVANLRVVPGKDGNDSREALPEEILDDFRPDIVFMDPARRGEGGSKVFLLEHCSPDVLQLKDRLLKTCRYLLLKLSPMADIRMLLERLGKGCRELHILEYGGECKEILVLVDREFEGECTIIAAAYAASQGKTPGWSRLYFSPDEIENAEPVTVRDEQGLSAGAILFEPGKGLMKTGAFNLLCRMFPLKELASSTHYYKVSDESCMDGILRMHGKFFSIKEAAPLNNRNIREFGKRYPHCEVTARNIRMDSETLRRKLGSSGGGTVHVFGLRCEFASGPENILVAAEKTGPASV